MLRKIFIIMSIIMFIAGSALAMGSAPEKKENIKSQEVDKVDIITKATEPPIAETEETQQQLKGKNILLIIASKDFNDNEYLVPRKIFEQNGAKVTVASSKKDIAVGIKGTRVTPDILVKDVKVRNYSAFVFIGGSGAEEYFDDKAAHSVAIWGFGSRKTVAAICTAPVILANSGILSGRKGTGLPSKADKLIDEGVIYTGSDVEVFGNTITANGPDAAEKFAKAVVKSLTR